MTKKNYLLFIARQKLKKNEKDRGDGGRVGREREWGERWKGERGGERNEMLVKCLKNKSDNREMLQFLLDKRTQGKSSKIGN